MASALVAGSARASEETDIPRGNTLFGQMGPANSHQATCLDKRAPAGSFCAPRAFGPWYDGRLTLIPRYSYQTFEREQPLYTTPPAAQRQWVGLTDDEFEDIELGCRSTPFGKIQAMQKVEAKLKEKNT